MYKIGSLFSGIGGFELGLERAIPSETIWQVEQDKFCQSILKKHWPNAKIYDDVRNITKDNVEVPDIICGGFPCQDISVAGKLGGIQGEKSGLWWEMWRIISELSQGRKKPIVVLENVSNIIRLGGREVLGSLAQIGYNAEWTTIRASDFGACHRRERWFCVAYPNRVRFVEHKRLSKKIQSKRNQGLQHKEIKKPIVSESTHSSYTHVTYPNSESQSSRSKLSTSLEGVSSYPNKSSVQKQSIDPFRVESKRRFKHGDSKNGGSYTRNYWEKGPIESPLCNVDDGISNRVARLKALGNAIVPQCSEWIGQQIWKSGILQGEEYV